MTTRSDCITVPIYPTYPPDLVAYLANDSQAKTLIGEDAAQLAKALQARPKDRGPRADHRAVAAEDLEVLGGGVALAAGVAYRTAGSIGVDAMSSRRTRP